jgi:hypothetical protein
LVAYIFMEKSQALIWLRKKPMPYFFVVNLDNKLTYETKGTWELRDDFMSGPFINYAIIDKRKQ